LVLINAPPPNYLGEAAVVAALEARFRHDMRRVFRYLEALGIGLLHVMAGEADEPMAKATFVANLKWAGGAADVDLKRFSSALWPVDMQDGSAVNITPLVGPKTH
tara:strand:+ start:5872 stop:6186 length:315 start_codon:yes stop_codon:yes gene_type:complete